MPLPQHRTCSSFLLPLDHIQYKISSFLRPDESRLQFPVPVAAMNAAIAILGEAPMLILLGKLPLAVRPTEDTLVRQKRIQVATCQPEGLADFRRCIAEAAIAVQLVEFFADDAVRLVEHLIVLDTEVHSDYSCLFHLSLFVLRRPLSGDLIN